jgi:Ca-activated chloride channel family protein
VEHLSDLSSIAARIGNQLRSEYVLGYSPANPTRDGKYHRVTVDLATPPDEPALQVSYRRGYHEPGD